MTHHGEALRRLVPDAELVGQLKVDFSKAKLPEKEAVMLAYVAKLTRAPSAVKQDDVQALRNAGFEDRAILDIAQIAGYFAFVTRIADGLGVTLEDV